MEDAKKPNPAGPSAAAQTGSPAAGVKPRPPLPPPSPNACSDDARVRELQRQLQYNEKLKYVTNMINSANDIDEILINLGRDILSLFDAQRITLYAVDPVKNELYSKYLSGERPKEIRVAISPDSLAGYSAYALEMVNVADVSDEMKLKAINPKLKFDERWDKESNFQTRQVLSAPLKHEAALYGVIQLVNKIGAPIDAGGDAAASSNLRNPIDAGGRTPGDRPFTKEDETRIIEIARVLAIAFRNKQKARGTRFNYLLEHGILTEDELKAAVTKAREAKKPVENVLIESYGVKKRDVGASLGTFYGLGYVEFSNKVFIARELTKSLNISYLKKALWLPIDSAGGRVTIVADNPTDIRISEIKSAFKADEYIFKVALRDDVLKFIDLLESDAESAKGSSSDILAELELEGKETEAATGEVLDENAGVIVRLANQVINEAYDKGASDIHIEPNRTRKIVDVRYRVDGDCFKHLTFPLGHLMALISRIKIMSSLDISERRLPQDGKIKFPMKKGPIELRVATIPTVNGESVVMRILAASEPLPVERLGLSKRNLQELKNIVEKPYGLFLVVGPTGSGKTTTLHSALGYINTPDTKIWTAEDPVEITQYGLCQVEVKPKIEFTFARAMRAFLRADPDVIMIGEMRDHETAATGIEASLTGHLVLSTLHTNSAPETITRLLDMGLDPFNFADAILGVLAQRLMRTLCSDCKEKYHPDKAEFEMLVDTYGREYFPELGIGYSDTFTLYRAKGCARCNDTGYRGRAGMHELLVGTPEAKRLIQMKSPMEKIRDQAIKDGMRTLFQDGVAKVFSGVTDIGQVRKVCIQ
jgi:type II secretory ATPase GspE/PulE/Tfp pilus assembly ATPase PilB-like protein